ncbi:hypothetical protein E2C01_091770 [Portunus trituberculatus]|uniref:Uncharacterized protein n=1 Tax=Portunus trituberculatus TaxID=210409 RepID=A0A5B7JTQ9_PORTR|nr:hypothetical protein [Portunus trituberculatus]
MPPSGVPLGVDPSPVEGCGRVLKATFLLPLGLCVGRSPPLKLARPGCVLLIRLTLRQFGMEACVVTVLGVWGSGGWQGEAAREV